MNFDEAREQLKGRLEEYVESITQRSRGKNLFNCPLCGSGTGKNGTGAFSIKNGTSWKCFSCGKGGDLFDLIGEYEGITDHAEQLKWAGKRFGVDVESAEYQKRDKTEQPTHNSIHTATPEVDYTDFFIQANKDIEKTDYRRGLSLETLNRFLIGYVESWKHPKRPKSTPTPRLIIPTSKHSYLARDTRAEIPEEQQGDSKLKVGSLHFFNLKALQNSKKPIIIVEGEIDALSIIEVGGEAIALGTTTKAKAFADLVKVQRPAQPIIIALDNDTAGTKASEDIIEGLEGADIPYYKLNICGRYKDANEALLKDREALRQAVEDAEHIQEEAEQAQKEEYLKTSSANCLQGFIDGIVDSVNTPSISTGFRQLDKVLDGGLYEGLYTVGAISSLGKTTFCLQIADQIAQAGQDVLIFSLEMARYELMAKSISRHTIQRILQEGGDERNAKTTRGITDGKRHQHYNPTEKKLIADAIRDYGDYAGHIFISEGIGDIGVKQIRNTIKDHIRYTGNKPVVVIDYIQILQPYNERATDKQNMDRAVIELKRISRDFKIPVIGISSLNRANYNTPISMEALKETGAIEYDSDVILGLQLKGVGKPKFDVNEAKKKQPRDVELVILKNRNAPTGDTLEYSYYAMFNYFKEV